MKNTKFSLTNRQISEKFQDQTFHLMLGDFTGAMAYWIGANQHLAKVDVDKPLKAFAEVLKKKYFKTDETVKDFTYKELNNLITGDFLASIPEILELNQIPSEHFYGLTALARNVFYMICRLQITQPI